MTEKELMKSKLHEILCTEDVVKSIKQNMDTLLTLIPEIESMIGFEHNHPHHHLNVWEHTLEVLKNLNTIDIELNLAGLLHDIGKPFSYQDEEVRHFRGHADASYKISKQVLTRLGYDEEFINRVLYLVLTHDIIIDTSNFDNEIGLVIKRLELQYADAKAHHPDKVSKRLEKLDEIRDHLNLVLY